MAAVNKDELVSDQNLVTAFKIFDKDGGGTVSSQEIKEVLGIGSEISEEVWDKVMNEVDENGDGDIDFDEFKQMMLGLLAG